MNRRDFTRGLASLGLIPALPLPAMGAGATVATATADKMYFVGWYTARLNKTCSPAVLASELNVDPSIAREIFAKLVKTNTVSAPNAMGVSQTISPLSDSYRRVTRKAAQRVITQKSEVISRKNIAKSKRTLLEDDQPEVTEKPDIDIVAEAEAETDLNPQGGDADARALEPAVDGDGLPGDKTGLVRA